ncbi:hypothetical protein Aoc01nite_27600 [Actinoplanes octamycinicus]|nr:hypothetical protein Aoc01nite_27600 [Actinoplanes octamycinicus]
MVILAVAAGIVLSRLRAQPAVPQGADPVVTTTVTESPAPETTTSRPKDVPTRKVTATATATATPAASETPDGPAISYFRVTGKPSCPSGTDQVRYEGTPVTLEWKVTGAEKATLSVDGPGVYAEYATKDSATLTFSCGGDPGGYQVHTYLLTAIGPDGTKTRKLTVKAKVNEIATT